MQVDIKQKQIKLTLSIRQANQIQADSSVYEGHFSVS